MVGYAFHRPELSRHCPSCYTTQEADISPRTDRQTVASVITRYCCRPAVSRLTLIARFVRQRFTENLVVAFFFPHVPVSRNEQFAGLFECFSSTKYSATVAAFKRHLEPFSDFPTENERIEYRSADRISRVAQNRSIERQYSSVGCTMTTVTHNDRVITVGLIAS